MPGEHRASVEVRLVVVERIAGADPRLLDGLDVGDVLVGLHLTDTGTEEARVAHLVIGIARFDEVGVGPVPLDVVQRRVEIPGLGVASALGVPAEWRLVVAHRGIRMFPAQVRDDVLQLGRVRVVAHDQTDAVLGPVLGQDAAGGVRHLPGRLV